MNALMTACSLFALSTALCFVPKTSDEVQAGASDEAPFMRQGSSFHGIDTLTDTGDAGDYWHPSHERSTLVLHFSPGCPGCDLAAPNWRELVDFLSESGASAAFDLSFTTTGYLEEAQAYLDSYDLEGPLRRLNLNMSADGIVPPESTRFLSTPQSWLIAPSGEVTKVRVGPIAEEEMGDWFDAVLEAWGNTDSGEEPVAGEGARE